MKKLFFLAAVVIAAVNVNAESAVYDWAANVGGTVMGGTTATGTVKVHGSSVNCIAFFCWPVFEEKVVAVLKKSCIFATAYDKVGVLDNG